MTVEQIIRFVESLGGVLTLRPSAGDGSPEIAWDDVFFHYAPDGVVPQGQPFATIVTKDYPQEPSSRLGDGVFRVNLDAGRGRQGPADDPTVRDLVIPHPVYGRLGWVSIVAPGPRTTTELPVLLTDAHARARRHWERRRSLETRE
ncbi:MAG: DUF6194 family protein [Intrasporangium sp.]|uniref:DUF6194 family protein n=1 Tax=Intrasporangium sp. TaxID=1925024 RepID=UPI00264855B2|nr:DUF6194 family protein [Intrasporangium sp.]MDN5796052.1 DUF6194 family protein [Intrasporangium sp.]